MPALESYTPPESDVEEFASHLARAIREGMVIGFSRQTPAKAVAFAEPPTPLPATEFLSTEAALKFLEDSDIRVRNLAEYLETGERWAIGSANLTTRTQVQVVKDLLLSELGAQGISQDLWSAETGHISGGALGRLDYGHFMERWEEEALPALDDYMTRLIFEQNVKTAQHAASWAQTTEPDHAELVVGLQYVATMDDRTRDDHAQWHLTIHPIDSPFWDSWYPPNGFNCRCTVVSIYAHDPEGKAILDGSADTGTRAQVRAGDDVQGKWFPKGQAPRQKIPIVETESGRVYNFNRNVGAMLKSGDAESLSGE